jgi:hypothetical protein
LNSSTWPETAGWSVPSPERPLGRVLRPGSTPEPPGPGNPGTIPSYTRSERLWESSEWVADRRLVLG